MTDTADTCMRRYEFKLYPTRQQEERLLQQGRMMASLWNAALEEREMHWRRQCQKYGAWETETYITPKGEQKERKRRKGMMAMEQARSIKLLRQQDPAWAAINADTSAKVLFLLDDAFKAFFRRAKQGAGSASGYPRYKRVADGMSIPFREMGKGWMMKPADEIAAEAAMGRFSPRAKAQTLHKTRRLPAHQVEAPANCGVTESFVETAAGERLVEAPANCGVTERTERQPIGRRRVEAPAKRVTRSWRVYVLGLCDRRDPSTWIKARGCFPQEPVSIRDSNISKRDGSWCLSVAVRMTPRRAAGSDKVTITFDLMDEFARVERAKGGCLARSKEQISTSTQQDSDTSGVVTAELGADDRYRGRSARPIGGVVTAELGADDRIKVGPSMNRWGVVTAELGADDRDKAYRSPKGLGVVTVETRLKSGLELERLADEVYSERDRRYRKRSWRWRRETARAGKLRACAKRIRSDALHRWSTGVVSSASDITVVIPDIATETKSPRGNEREWGASVEAVSGLNRNTLNQAPATARQMLEYKAAEAGIRCDVILHDAPKIAVGRDLVATGKLQRRAKRQLKKSM